MSEDQRRRKVRTREGFVGMVMTDLGRACTLRVKHTEFYPLVSKEDLEDIPEDEFVREFGRYK